MDLVVSRASKLSGAIKPPGSKSQSVRALIFASLAQGKSKIANLLAAEDCYDAIQAVQQLGVSVSKTEDGYSVEGLGQSLMPRKNTIYSGNSGITTHFLMPLLGLRLDDQPIILSCGEQMQLRPIGGLVEPLQQLGLTIEYLNVTGFAPIKISGRLRGGQAEVSGITSQYLSALLIALPCAECDSQISVRNLSERSYVAMTLEWLKQQNIHYCHQQDNDLDIFTIPGRQRYSEFATVIPGDFSSASYLIAAAVLCQGEVTIDGLAMNDSQGDKALITILKNCGADITIGDDQLTIVGGNVLQGFNVNLQDIPDLLPTLAVIATQAQGVSTLHCASHTRIKETDRIHSMTQGLRKMGIQIEEYDDKMIIYPGKLIGTQINGYNDHRTVMAFALAGMLAEGITRISDGAAIQKTFPEFVQVMQSLGANMDVSDE